MNDVVRAMLVLMGAALVAGDAAGATQLPEGIVFNETMETYTVQRVPTRTLDAVLTSLRSWRHQVLADGSTADFLAEDGILSMECTGCGQARPSAIELAKIDLRSVMAYRAGNWNIGIRSTDGAQDFRGLLRGELGPGPHEAARVSDDERIALTALADLYDLAYLTQNPPPALASRESAPRPASLDLATPQSSEPAAAKPVAISLTALANSGEVEKILEQQRAKPGARDIAGALETAYGVRARLMLLAGEVDSSLQMLGAARQKFGKSAVLRDLETSYVVVGDAYDRLRWGVKIDVPALQGFLERIGNAEPRDAAAIEQMLAQTLSNRIADQRAAGRSAIAEDLLSAGRTLFPGLADLLTSGKAGMLPASGLEVGTTAPAQVDQR